MNERALGKIRKKKEAFDRYKRTREGEDYLEYAKARNSVKTEVRKAVRDYEKEVAKQSKRNPKAFYKYVNSKLKTRSGIGNLRTETGKEVECDKDKADMFNNFFSSVYETEDVTSLPTQLEVTVNQRLDSVEFSQSDVLQLLKKLDANKSPGPDGIHPRVLKECAAELAGPLHILFQTSLSEGSLPTAWKEAKVTPIFKKGSRADVDNYRPVSLTSVCCKVMEKLIRHAVMNHMIINGFLSDYQHGFVQGRSCTHSVIVGG